MGAQVAKDIAEYTISLIPLADHTTVSALSCVCHEASPLFAHFLAVNDIVYVRAVACNSTHNDATNSATIRKFPVIDDFCALTRYHGVFTCSLSYADIILLENGWRAYVMNNRRASDPRPVVQRYVFGTRVAWETEYSRNDIVMAENRVVGVITTLCHKPEIYLRLRIDHEGQPPREVIRLLYVDTDMGGRWGTISQRQIVHKLDYRTLASMHIEKILVPYQERAIRLWRFLATHDYRLGDALRIE
jgi:hypothetical protein